MSHQRPSHMDIDIGPEAIGRRAASLERRFWRRRVGRAEWQYASMAADLADIRLREVFRIQKCREQQQVVDRLRNLEAEHQAGCQLVASWFADTRMDDYEDILEFLEAVENLPAAVAQRAVSERADRACQHLKMWLRSLLAYTKLRRKLHIIFVQDCSRQAQHGDEITDEQRTALSSYSSAPEYGLNDGGGDMFGFFELLIPELDIVASTQGWNT